MKINILTLFPEMYENILNNSIIKRAINDETIEINLVNFRDYSNDKHHKVDDYSYGGGPGMLLKVEPIYSALNTLSKDSYNILLTPVGELFDQQKAVKYSKYNEITLICGRYEGFDDRIRNFVDEEISIGDFILTNGELASLIIIDSVTRLLDGVIKTDSHEMDSFSNQLLEYPQFTKPRIFNELSVPDVLLSGDHEKIRKFRLYESLKRTYIRKPHILRNKDLNEEEKKMLKMIKGEIQIENEK